MKLKAIYNVVDASMMPGKAAGERTINAVKVAIKMAEKNPETETTYFKFNKPDNDQG